MTEPPRPAAQPLYPHTLAMPPEQSSDARETLPPPSVDIDALSDLYDRCMSAVLYLDRTLNPTDRQAVFDQHQLVAEYDVVRGVDSLRHATPDELAAP